MNNLKVNSAHIALMLARDCFGLRASFKELPERVMRPADQQYAKIAAAKQKRLARQQRNLKLQEGQ